MKLPLLVLSAAVVAACGPDGPPSTTSTAALHRSSLVRMLPPEVPFPEGIAAARSGALYVGSLTTGAVARFGPRQLTGEVWLRGGQLQRGAVGLQVDDRRQVLWICDASPFDPTASALVGFALRTRALVATHPLPVAPGGTVFCNDIDVSPRGDLFVTDSFGGRVLRVQGRDALSNSTAELWNESTLLVAPGDPPFGANGIVATRNAVFVVNFNTGTLIRIPRRRGGASGTARVVPIFDRGRRVSLGGPDGISRLGPRALLVAENGVFGGANRLSRIDLKRRSGRLSGTLRPLASGLDTPTTAATVGRVAWVVEGQLDHFLGLDPSPPDPFRLIGVRLP